MTHSFNLESINESAFLLENLVFASESFCTNYEVSKKRSASEWDWQYYEAWLNTFVSDHLIQSSTKVRMLLDMLRRKASEAFIREIAESSIDGLDLGKILPAEDRLDLREACNKVIHAINVRFEHTFLEEERVYYWSGWVILIGHKNKEEWTARLDVQQFAVALRYFVERIAKEVDWFRIDELE